jgi:hypothetical protein
MADREMNIKALRGDEQRYKHLYIWWRDMSIQIKSRSRFTADENVEENNYDFIALLS